MSTMLPLAMVIQYISDCTIWMLEWKKYRKQLTCLFIWFPFKVIKHWMRWAEIIHMCKLSGYAPLCLQSIMLMRWWNRLCCVVCSGVCFAFVNWLKSAISIRVNNKQRAKYSRNLLYPDAGAVQPRAHTSRQPSDLNVIDAMYVSYHKMAHWCSRGCMWCNKLIVQHAHKHKNHQSVSVERKTYNFKGPCALDICNWIGAITSITPVLWLILFCRKFYEYLRNILKSRKNFSPSHISFKFTCKNSNNSRYLN